MSTEPVDAPVNQYRAVNGYINRQIDEHPLAGMDSVGTVQGLPVHPLALKTDKEAIGKANGAVACTGVFANNHRTEIGKRCTGKVFKAACCAFQLHTHVSGTVAGLSQAGTAKQGRIKYRHIGHAVVTDLQPGNVPAKTLSMRRDRATGF